MLEIHKCKTDVAKVTQEYDLEKEMQELVGEINAYGGMISVNRKCLGEIPMHLERHGERLNAQIHLVVTIDEDEFIEIGEKEEL